MRRHLVFIVLLILLGLAALAAGMLAPRWVAVRPGMAGCSSIRDVVRRTTCVQHRMEDAVKEVGLSAAARQADAAGDRVPVNEICHMSLHAVGDGIGKSRAKSDEDLPVVAPSTNCSQGLVHGMLIGYLDSASWKQISSVDPARCPGVDNGSGGDYQQVESCVHSLGHAMYRSKPELENGARACISIVERATRELAASRHQEMQDSCIGGMMMERTFADLTVAGTCPETEDATVRAELRSACIRYIPINLVQAGTSARAAGAACDQLATTDDERIACGRTVATVITKPAQCAKMGKVARTTCVQEWSVNKAAETGLADAT